MLSLGHSTGAQQAAPTKKASRLLVPALVLASCPSASMFVAKIASYVNITDCTDR